MTQTNMGEQLSMAPHSANAPHSTPAESVETPRNGTPALIESPAPADLEAPARRRVRFSWYAGVVLLASILVVFGHSVVWLDGFKFLPYSPFVDLNTQHLGLRTSELSAPFLYDDDALLILPMAKSFIETGTHWHTERMGCPGAAELSQWYPAGLELYDFPVIDHLHFAILWLLGRVFSNLYVVYNLYYLLTYPLTALTAMAVLRYLRLTLPAAATGGLLYAFLPYHYMRGEGHYFLAAYWLVPVSLVPLFQIFRGDYPFFRRESGVWRFRPFTWNSLGQVLLGAATASAGAYYAFFACVTYGAGGSYAFWMKRNWRVLATTGIVSTLVLIFGILNHMPKYLNEAQVGKHNVADRDPLEAESFGMKIPQLVLPINEHNLTVLNRLKARYNTIMRPVQNENSNSSLGIIGSVGFVVLLSLFLFPSRRGWPYGPLAFLAGFIVFFAIIGGLGSLFNFFIFAQVRCYNRLSVVLAFLCLFAVLWPVDRYLLTRTRWARRLRYPAFILLTGIGIFDQTPFSWFSERGAVQLRKQANRFHADERFFAEIEADMPEGSRVFCLPYIPFPEYPAVNKMRTYDHARGYLHTQTLRWSYGAMKGRDADIWARHLAFDRSSDRNAEETLAWIMYRGFDGIFIDARGYDFVKLPNEDVINGGHLLSRTIQRLAPPNAPIRSITHPEDPDQLFLDIRAYRDWRRQQDPAGYAHEEKRIREWPVLTWLDGFITYNPMCETSCPIWAQGRATAVLMNPTDRTRIFDLRLALGIDADGLFRFRIACPNVEQIKDGQKQPWSDAFTMDRPAAPPVDPNALESKETEKDRLHVEWRNYRLIVPPGRHTIIFRCEAPFLYMPHDHRPVYYFIRDYSLEEVRTDHPTARLEPGNWRGR